MWEGGSEVGNNDALAYDSPQYWQLPAAYACIAGRNTAAARGSANSGGKAPSASSVGPLIRLHHRRHCIIAVSITANDLTASNLIQLPRALSKSE